MLCGEAPGRDEDELGIPFVGKSGKLLDSTLASIGLKRSEVYVTNGVKCRPPANNFKLAEQARAPGACFPYLAEEIATVRPKVIVAIGIPALKALTGRTGIKDNRGQLLKPDPKVRLNGAKLITTYHPSYVIRQGKWAPDKRLADDLRNDLDLARRIASVETSTAALPENSKKLLLPGYSLSTLERALARVDSEHVVLDGEWTALADREFTYPWSKGAEMLSASISAWHSDDQVNSSSFAFPLPKGGKGLLNEFFTGKKVSNHHIQVDAIWFWWLGIRFEIEHDTMHAAFVLDEEQRRGLETLAMLYAGVSSTWKQPKWPAPPGSAEEWRKLLDYGSMDTWSTTLLLDALLKQLKARPEPERSRIWHIYRMMCEAIPSYVEMAHVGLPASPEKLTAVKTEINAGQQQAITTFAQALRTSPQQALKVATNYRETTNYLNHAYGLSLDSSRVEVLDDISDTYEHVALIKRIRHPEKIKGTYIDPWLALMHEQGDRTIRAVYSQELVTGRTSASTGYRGGTGQVTPAELKGVIEAPEGWVIISADQCLARGTEVQTIRGVKTIETVRPGEFVYAVDDKGKPIAAQVAARKFIGHRQVFRLVLQPYIAKKGGGTTKGPLTSVLATAEHKFMLRDGSYAELQDLNPGVRLMHMTRYHEDTTGYIHLYTHKRNRSEQHVIVEALTGKPIPKGKIVHHVNHNRTDNEPENLAVVDRLDHFSYHGKEQWQKRDAHQVAELRKRMGEGISRAIKAAGGRKGELNGHFGHKKGITIRCEVCGKERYCYPSQKNYRYCSRECANIGTAPQRSGDLHYKRRQAVNHRVVSITPVATLPVYCLDVPGPRNFMLANGVISSNSQVELRLLASRAKERRMIEVYNSKDPRMRDLHMNTAAFFSATAEDGKLTAAKFWERRLEWMLKYGDWKGEDAGWKSPIRQPGKVSNFSLGYGLAADKFQVLLFNQYKIRKTLEEATQMRNKHFQLWDGLPHWHEEGQRDYRKGFTVSFLGRYRRHLKDRNSALNSPIQSDGSDIVQIAQTEIHSRFQKYDIDAYLSGENHDALLTLAREDEALDISEEIIRPCMEQIDWEKYGFEGLPVPLVADIHIGRTWAG